MKKKALLIGINIYKGGQNLNGCVNDVLGMRSCLLDYFDMNADDIRVLVNERATKKNIMSRLNWLVDDSAVALLHFSGHGSQVRDRNGDELRDGLDEIICPYDFDWDENHYITDDELGKALYGYYGILDVIMDCCHAESNTREAMLKQLEPCPTPLPTIANSTPRFIAPPIDILCREDPAVDYSIHKLLGGRPYEKEEDGQILGASPSHAQPERAVFAGCESYQTSADAYLNGAYHGAFTFFICKWLRNFRGHISRSSLVGRVRGSLRMAGFTQNPRLAGPHERFVASLFDKWGEK